VQKLKPWLYRIAHNTALNALRDRGLHHAPLPESLDGVEQPDQAAERRQRLREVLVAVERLPVRQRDALVLRALEGRSYDEIAAQLGVTGGAVRQLLNRARHSIRAGVTAVTPIGLLLRVPVPLVEAPVSARVAELCGAGSAGGAAAKVCAAALVTGTLAGGVTALPGERPDAAGPAVADARAAVDAASSTRRRAAAPPAARGPKPSASTPTAAASSGAPIRPVSRPASKPAEVADDQRGGGRRAQRREARRDDGPARDPELSERRQEDFGGGRQPVSQTPWDQAGAAPDRQGSYPRDGSGFHDGPGGTQGGPSTGPAGLH
jgi:hypothetical protein